MEFFWKWTIYNGRRIGYVNYQTDTDELNFIVYRYQNNVNLKKSEMELKTTENGKLLSEWVYLLSYIDLFFNWYLELDETTVHNENKLRQERMFSL